ncbi:hypothetical protein AJ80_07873, partial [Polytolypa hystricis UAMH7299]
MVYPFSLPTPSPLHFPTHLSSPTHPALPQTASTQQHALRTALKQHNRLSPQQQDTNLPLVLNALDAYIPYLIALERATTQHEDNDTNGGRIIVNIREEIFPEWRAPLTSPSPSSIPSFLHRAKSDPNNNPTPRPRSNRIRGRGLSFELAFVLSTRGYVLSNLARARYLSTLYATTTPSVEQKVSAVKAGMKYLTQASSMHIYLSTCAPILPPSLEQLETTIVPADVEPTTQSSLSSLALAEATLLAVTKDDAYLSACIQSRNSADKEWMLKAPDIPKVRALLFARLCVRAAEYAEAAGAAAGAVGVSSSGGGVVGKVNERLIGYMALLARVSRARACRFFGIDAELGGRMGEAIAWLRAGRGVLGVKSAGSRDEEKQKEQKEKSGIGLGRLKRGWELKREERKLEKSATPTMIGGKRGLDWGDEAGRDEEARVIEMLEKRWVRVNDT